MLEEKVYISQFDVRPDGRINLRKTTEIFKDGESISSTYWRCVLEPNDPNAADVLNEPFYYNLAQLAWNSLSAN